jgi:hypothetical protein
MEHLLRLSSRVHFERILALGDNRRHFGFSGHLVQMKFLRWDYELSSHFLTKNLESIRFHKRFR